MFAIVKTGGKQYRVTKGDVVKLEKIEGEVGAKIALDNVLLVNDGNKSTIGTPTVEGAAVSAEILEQKRDGKIIIFKKKRRKNHRRKNGHRQSVTVVRITDIAASGAKKAAAPKKEAAAKEEAPKAEKKAAPKKTATKKKED